MRMGVKGKERNKMMNKNSVSSLINFIQLVCFTISQDLQIIPTVSQSLRTLPIS